MDDGTTDDVRLQSLPPSAGEVVAKLTATIYVTLRPPRRIGLPRGLCRVRIGWGNWLIQDWTSRTTPAKDLSPVGPSPIVFSDGDGGVIIDGLGPIVVTAGFSAGGWHGYKDYDEIRCWIEIGRVDGTVAYPVPPIVVGDRTGLIMRREPSSDLQLPEWRLIPPS